MLEVMESLRKWKSDNVPTIKDTDTYKVSKVLSNERAIELESLLDQLEREIAENWVMKPKDRNGDAIDVNDHAYCAGSECPITYMKYTKGGWLIGVEDGGTVFNLYPTNVLRIRQRTLRETLRDLISSCAEISPHGIECNDKALDGWLEEHADEISLKS